MCIHFRVMKPPSTPAAENPEEFDILLPVYLHCPGKWPINERSITSSKVEKCSVNDSKRSSDVSPGADKPRTANRLLNLKSDMASDEPLACS